MALAQRRIEVIEVRRITNESEYRAAIARIEELIPLDDVESIAELECWANYVEAWDTKRRLPRD
jgi:antitoxin component HigA of HigAB toxin-antitoxin module